MVGWQLLVAIALCSPSGLCMYCMYCKMMVVVATHTCCFGPGRLSLLLRWKDACRERHNILFKSIPVFLDIGSEIQIILVGLLARSKKSNQLSYELTTPSTASTASTHRSMPQSTINHHLHAMVFEFHRCFCCHRRRHHHHHHHRKDSLPNSNHNNHNNGTPLQPPPPPPLSLAVTVTSRSLLRGSLEASAPITATPLTSSSTTTTTTTTTTSSVTEEPCFQVEVVLQDDQDELQQHPSDDAPPQQQLPQQLPPQLQQQPPPPPPPEAGWMTVLQQACPLATPAECERFYRAYSGGHDDDDTTTTRSRSVRRPRNHAPVVVAAVVIDRLQAYLAWRQRYSYHLDAVTTTPHGTTNTTPHASHRHQDRANWESAWDVAWSHAAQDPSGRDYFPGSASPTNRKKTQQPPPQYPKRRIPQYIFAHIIDTTNTTTTTTTATATTATTTATTPPIPHLVLQIVPAQIALTEAPAALHALALSLYLGAGGGGQHQRNDATSQALLLLDTRGADPWANPTVFQLLDLIRIVSHTLVPLFPGRLHELVVFPLPGWAVVCLRAALHVLPKVLRDRLTLIPEYSSNSRTVGEAMEATLVQRGLSPQVWKDMTATRHQAIEEAAEERRQRNT